ncbi:hypothetical protein ACRALDRAFT_211197 [Sodiomyces alcalophilus JCM 7366]|uniref:uncharacterized protein n=1 Tax=Sodiomyces alcalophilus JCM 7366 TaxID=591952 RepID=UPI0039B51059
MEGFGFRHLLGKSNMEVSKILPLSWFANIPKVSHVHSPHCEEYVITRQFAAAFPRFDLIQREMRPDLTAANREPPLHLLFTSSPGLGTPKLYRERSQCLAHAGKGTASLRSPPHLLASQFQAILQLLAYRLAPTSRDLGARRRGGFGVPFPIVPAPRASASLLHLITSCSGSNGIDVGLQHGSTSSIFPITRASLLRSLRSCILPPSLKLSYSHNTVANLDLSCGPVEGNGEGDDLSMDGLPLKPSYGFSVILLALSCNVVSGSGFGLPSPSDNLLGGFGQVGVSMDGEGMPIPYEQKVIGVYNFTLSAENTKKLRWENTTIQYIQPSTYCAGKRAVDHSPDAAIRDITIRHTGIHPIVFSPLCSNQMQDMECQLQGIRLCLANWNWTTTRDSRMPILSCRGALLKQQGASANIPQFVLSERYGYGDMQYNGTDIVEQGSRASLSRTSIHLSPSHASPRPHRARLQLSRSSPPLAEVDEIAVTYKRRIALAATDTIACQMTFNYHFTVSGHLPKHEECFQNANGAGD